jgi:DNA-binding protein H-NS
MQFPKPNEVLMTDLKALIAQKAELEARIAAEKPTAVATVRALMDELGVSVAELGAVRKLNKRPAQFRCETGETWAGVGKRPRWLQDRLSAGATLEQFRVK